MASNPASQSKFITYVEAHPLMIAGGVVVAGLLLSAAMQSRKNNAATTTPTATTNTAIPGTYNNGINPMTGQPYTNLNQLINPATGLPTVYVPTSTNFTTNNVGAAISGSQGPVTVNAANSITPLGSSMPTTRVVSPVVPIAPAKPIVNNPVPMPSTPVVVASPTPVSQAPAIPPPQKTMQWSGSYTVRSGDTLSGIASMVTNSLRSQGAPPTTAVTYQMIYSNNQSVINSTASAHGNPIPGGPQNNIFPGEVLRIPVWA